MWNSSRFQLESRLFGTEIFGTCIIVMIQYFFILLVRLDGATVNPSRTHALTLPYSLSRALHPVTCERQELHRLTGQCRFRILVSFAKS